MHDKPQRVNNYKPQYVDILYIENRLNFKKNRVFTPHFHVKKTLEIGKKTYLTKNSDSEMIHEAVKTVYKQEYFFYQLTIKALIDGLRVKSQAEAAMPVDD